MSREAITAVSNKKIPRLITISSDIAIMARDGKALQKAGYDLVESPAHRHAAPNIPHRNRYAVEKRP